MAEWHRIITSPYTGSMSMTGSFNVDGDATITGNVTINGTASVENLVVKQIGYSSGSNQLGDAVNDVQTLYGTVRIPTGSLVVTGSTSILGNISLPYGYRIEINGENFYSYGGLDFGGQVQINSRNNNSIFFSSNGVERMRIIGGSSGNVNIGPIAPYYDPGYRLNISGSGVSGSLNANNTLYVSGSNVGIGTTAPSFKLDVSGDTRILQSSIYMDSSGDPTIFGRNAVGTEQSRIMVRSQSHGGMELGTRTGYLSFQAGPGAYTERMRITNSGLIGIGTTAPSASLHVVGNTILSGSAGTGSALTVYKSGSTVVDVQGSSGQLFSITDSLTGSLFSVNTAAGLPTIEAFSDNTVNIGKYGSYPIKVVSLGTSAVISGSFSGSGANLSGIPASAIVGLNLSQIATGSVSASVGLGTGSFQITSGSSNFFFVSSSGNVGIGTTTPTAPLEIVQTQNAYGDLNGFLVRDSSNIQANFTIKGGTGVSSPRIMVSSLSDSLGGGIGGTGLIVSYLDNNTFHPLRSLASRIDFETTATNYDARTTIMRANPGGVLIGTTTDIGSRLGVRGSGATSSTTALLVQNSNASSSLEIKDDQTVTMPGTVNVGTLYAAATNGTYRSILTPYDVNSVSLSTNVRFGGTYSTSADVTLFGGTSQVVINGATGNNAGSALVITGTTNANTDAQNKSVQTITSNFTHNNSSVLQSFRLLNLEPTINQSGISVAHVRGIYYNPTITSIIGPHTAIETTSGNVRFGGNTQVTITGSFTVVTGSAVEFQVNQTGVKIGNAPTDSHSITGSLAISASAGTGSALTVYKSGSTVVDIQGSQGSLMSVEDSLTGSLMSVGNISGLPLMEVFDDGTMNAGKFNVYPIKIVATGSQAVITGSFTGSFAGSINASAFTASSALVTGNVTVLGTASINNLIVNQIGYSSGSNQLGDAANDTQTLYGTVVIPTGSLTVSGSTSITGSLSQAGSSGFSGGTYTFYAAGAGDGGLRIDTTINGYNSLNWLSNTVGLGLMAGGGLFAKVSNNAGFHIGQSPSSTFVAALAVTGHGTTTSPTFIARNSAGTNILRVVDSGLVGINNAAPSASLHVVGNTLLSGSAGTSSALNVYKSGSTVFRVEGSQGELFAVTDSLSGSLFSVSNVSGLPILEVFSDNTTLVGDYLAPALITTKKMTVNSGSTALYSLATASYDGGFFDYTLRSGSNARAGQIMSIWSGSSVNYTEIVTSDFGDTSGFLFGSIVSGSNMVLTGSASTSGWTLKTIIRSI